MRRFALLLTALAACSSSHARDGQPKGVAASDASAKKTAANDAIPDKVPRDDADLEPKGVAGSAADSAMHTAAASADDASSSRAAASPPQVRDRASVWIGEAERTITHPGESSNGAGPQRVVLILDALHDVPTGTITFGTGQLPKPQATDTFYPPGFNGDDVFYWQNAPIEGFEYSLVASQMSGDLLSFAFVPLEFYRDFCALRTSDTRVTLSPSSPGVTVRVCECDEARCKTTDSPQRRITLRVSVDAMEGELAGVDESPVGDPPIIRLRRVQ